MALVAAYDTRTGKKLPHFVPEHHIDHPVFGQHLSATPPKETPRTAPAAVSADDGDNHEKENI